MGIEDVIGLNRTTTANSAVVSSQHLSSDLVSPREFMVLDGIWFHANLGAEEKLPKVREALAYLIHKCGGKKGMF